MSNLDFSFEVVEEVSYLGNNMGNSPGCSNNCGGEDGGDGPECSHVQDRQKNTSSKEWLEYLDLNSGSAQF